MKRFITLFCALLYVPLIQAQDPAVRIAIIKADDVRSPSENWKRFFKISAEKGIKVSAGVICDSLEGAKPAYVQWLKSLQDSGMVEFWNHGWDHKRWTSETDKTVFEFKGSGYEHQKKHFGAAQTLMEKILGTAPVAFGAPFNAIDADTVKIMNEDTDVQLFFGYGFPAGYEGILAGMKLRGEHDGTGKPNFGKFKSDYEKKPVTFSAIQFHPNSFSEQHFDEYAGILDFLIAEGWHFVLPSEYIAIAKQENK